jgi:hypothetical protein
VSAQNRRGLQPGEGGPGRPEPQKRMQREALVARAVAARCAECVAAHEHAPLGPPDGDLLPAPAHPHHSKLERRKRLLRDDVVRHAESSSERSAVAVVAIEELDDAGRLARSADALQDSLTVERVDQPDAFVDDQRMRAALDELVDDPTEAALELVAEADAHPADLTATP